MTRQRVSAENIILSPRKQLLSAITDKQLNTSFCCRDWQMKWYIVPPIIPPIQATCIIEHSVIVSNASRSAMSLPVNQGESSYLSTCFSRRFACDKIKFQQYGPVSKARTGAAYCRTSLSCIWLALGVIPSRHLTESLPQCSSEAIIWKGKLVDRWSRIEAVWSLVCST